MDDTRPADVLGTGAQKMDLEGYQEPEEPEKEMRESVHTESHQDMKALYIALSELLKDVSIRVDLESLEESERIRKINEILGRIVHFK